MILLVRTWKSNKGTAEVIVLPRGGVRHPSDRLWRATASNNQQPIMEWFKWNLMAGFGFWIKVLIRLWISPYLLKTGLCVYTPECAPYKTVKDMNIWYNFTHFHFKKNKTSNVPSAVLQSLFGNKDFTPSFKKKQTSETASKTLFQQQRNITVNNKVLLKMITFLRETR